MKVKIDDTPSYKPPEIVTPKERCTYCGGETDIGLILTPSKGTEVKICINCLIKAFDKVLLSGKVY